MASTNCQIPEDCQHFRTVRKLRKGNHLRTVRKLRKLRFLRIRVWRLPPLNELVSGKRLCVNENDNDSMKKIVVLQPKNR